MSSAVVNWKTFCLVPLSVLPMSHSLLVMVRGGQFTVTIILTNMSGGYRWGTRLACL